jgi:hypothetical protein
MIDPTKPGYKPPQRPEPPGLTRWQTINWLIVVAVVVGILAVIWAL